MEEKKNLDDVPAVDLLSSIAADCKLYSIPYQSTHMSDKSWPLQRRHAAKKLKTFKEEKFFLFPLEKNWEISFLL